MKEDQEHYTPKETEQRLRRTLKAAFNMRPTQLKAIPRKLTKDQPPRAKPSLPRCKARKRA